MSLSQIEAELENLTSEELRASAIKTWDTFIQKKGKDSPDECLEDDPDLLRALDQAIAIANAPGSNHSTGAEVKALLRAWTSSR